LHDRHANACEQNSAVAEGRRKSKGRDHPCNNTVISSRYPSRQSRSQRCRHKKRTLTQSLRIPALPQFPLSARVTTERKLSGSSIVVEEPCRGPGNVYKPHTRDFAAAGCRDAGTPDTCTIAMQTHTNKTPRAPKAVVYKRTEHDNFRAQSGRVLVSGRHSRSHRRMDITTNRTDATREST
jgi:hypothetical protein